MIVRFSLLALLALGCGMLAASIAVSQPLGLHIIPVVQAPAEGLVALLLTVAAPLLGHRLILPATTRWWPPALAMAAFMASLGVLTYPTPLPL